MPVELPVGSDTTPVVIRHDPLKGRGVFAARFIEAGETIEVAPVSVITADEAEHLEHTPLGHHYFHWDGDEAELAGWRGAVAFGIVSLVNHAEQANAGVWPDHGRHAMVLEALEPIEPGEEITIHYDVDLWFDAV